MTNFLLIQILLFGAVTFYFGVISLIYLPLAFAYVFWERNLITLAKTALYTPRVSVLVPAYNEERTIQHSIRSILDSDYPDFEVIVINDGSTDTTAAKLQPFITKREICYVEKNNGGKASALNAGIALATGDIMLFTDADSLFEKHTIRNGVAYFVDPTIGALSGNDTPLNPTGALQKMLVVTSHIGTGLVRRALSMARVLPIIPGNLGMVRSAILRQVGGFREIWGEDLEITFRLQRFGVRIVYGARTRVIAECPHTLRGLWKQRVRWIRSYIMVVFLHSDMIARSRFGFYLLLNLFNMLIIPILQLLNLLLLPLALERGIIHLQDMEWVAYLGFGSLLVAAMTAILLDRTPKDMLYLPYTLVLLPLSYFYTAVVIYAIWAHSHAYDEDWNKLERRHFVVIAPPPDRWRRRLVFGSATVASLAIVSLVTQVDGEELLQSTELFPNDKPVGGKLTVAIHFSDWDNWRDASESLLASPGAEHIDRIAISAGRPDWTYFKWSKRRLWWSPDQKNLDDDMLAETIATLKAKGYATTVMLDVLAPRYLQLHPDCAARDIDGKLSTDIVCSTCMANEEYGNLLDAAFRALATRPEVDSICITELFYDKHCYDERCFADFQQASGRTDWPRLGSGVIDYRHSAIGKWRSEQVRTAIARLSDIARFYGKEILVDVRVSRDDLSRNSSENGQDYRLLLPLVDQLVVWDYFALDHFPPSATGKVARYLSRHFGAKRYWHSIGLWNDKSGAIDADQLSRSIRAARKGGSTNIWITPGKFLNPTHWNALEKLKVGRGYTDKPVKTAVSSDATVIGD